MTARKPRRAVPAEPTPGTVTALSEEGKRPGRYAVCVDGKRMAVVNAELIHSFGVRVGHVLSESEARRVCREADQLTVFDRAVVLLQVRARSRSDLVRRLQQEGWGREIIDAAMGRLEHLGLQDDREFARTLAARQATRQGMSRRRVEQELRRHGVSREVAADAAGGAFEGADEMESALAAAEKRQASLLKLDPVAARRRLEGFLSRRGYDADVVRRVVREVLRRGDTE